ncbi:hypothetical protein EON63_05420 [archaeon]|nr:MAG: hypothetical protein EON63_05420 [archaeon]
MYCMLFQLLLLFPPSPLQQCCCCYGSVYAGTPCSIYGLSTCMVYYCLVYFYRCAIYTLPATGGCCRSYVGSMMTSMV